MVRADTSSTCEIAMAGRPGPISQQLERLAERLEERGVSRSDCDSIRIWATQWKTVQKKNKELTRRVLELETQVKELEVQLDAKGKQAG
jgi:hypothetical protein